MANQLFGYTADGVAVEEYTLRSGKMTATVLTLGGIIRTLRVGDVDVIGGYDTVADYEEDKSHQGALIGRVGNRIANGVFTLNGKTYELAKNNGNHHLHGGPGGFDRVMWTVEEADDTHITLSLLSPDGDENYPGNLFVKVTYTLSDEGIMIAYNAICDADCPVNLTNHAYFNLKGYGSCHIGDTVATICADRYTEVDDELIPTGNRPSVEGTVFDFRTPHTIGERLGAGFDGYDHNLLFAGAEVKEVMGIELPHVATFSVPTLTMEVYTDQEGAQLYIGNGLGGAPDFKNGVKRQKQHAFCFETQSEPDGINHGAPALKKGELYHTVTVYRFI